MKMFKLIFSLFCFLFFSEMAYAQQDIDLWTDGLPNSNGIDSTQPYDDAKLNFKPTMRVFLPDKSVSNHMAIICLPGGGYSHLATGHEGYDWSDYFCKLGFTYIVLKYRMPNGHKEVPYSDVKEAFRLVRKYASEWGINSQKIGIMGSSAGGHLASTYATHTDSLSKPYFQILFYPVISMKDNITHEGSRNHLLGLNPSPDIVEEYSNDLKVDNNTPTSIILLSDDDKTVPCNNGVEYYLALKRYHIPASLHVYPSGGHGWGNRNSFAFHTEMLADLTSWLKQIK